MFPVQMSQLFRLFNLRKLRERISGSAPAVPDRRESGGPWRVQLISHADPDRRGC